MGNHERVDCPGRVRVRGGVRGGHDSGDGACELVQAEAEIWSGQEDRLILFWLSGFFIGYSVALIVVEVLAPMAEKWSKDGRSD